VTTVTPTLQGLRRRARIRGGVWSKSLTFKLALGIIVMLAIGAVVSAFYTPYPPMQPATGPFFSPPSWSHLFGTDAVGADIFSRTFAATHVDVGITVAVVGLSLAVGTIWGSLVGFYGGWADGVTLRILQTLQSFPALLLAMLVISVLGRGIMNVILVVALLPLPDYVRLARAEVMTKKTWQFAEAARMSGRSPVGVLFRHLVPNSMRPLFANASINASWVAATVGALGFVGLGIQPGSVEWGSMISGGQQAINNGGWWISFFPGLGIFCLSAAFHLLGDALSDADITRRS
jgi:peptide/nickel transport system permease protein